MSRTRSSDQQLSFELTDAPQPEISTAIGPAQAIQSAAMVLNDPEQLDRLLQHWREADWIRPLDVAFARTIRDLCAEQGEPPAALPLLLAALVSHQVGRGHVCIDLAMLLDDAVTTLALPPDEARPASLQALSGLKPADLLAATSLYECTAALQASLAVGDGSYATPLVLDGTRLYLRRFWGYEQGIARGIQQRLQQSSPLADASSPAAQTLEKALDVLFPSEGGMNGSGAAGAQKEAVNFQKLACALAARHRFAIITGGPGTGKTTTVVNLLAALQAVAGEDPQRQGRKFRIRLAAPTGKAAARLNESIGGAVSRLPLHRLPGNVGLDDIPVQVTTLHRLLGARPNTRSFRHHRDHPLLVDILVIDEASMVDVDLMAAVFEALPPHTQLILLGDKDQLASVDAGAVLGDLCQRAASAHYLPDTARWLQAITGQPVPEHLIDPEGQPLDQAVAMLRKSYRFSDESGIRQLAEAVNTDRLDDTMLAQCRTAAFDDVIWLNGTEARLDTETTLEQICRHAVSGTAEAFHKSGEGRVVNGVSLPPPMGYRHYLTLMQHQPSHDSPREAWDELARSVLEAFGDFQVLCALRRGPWGVEGLNDRIARALLVQKLIPRAEGWYAGRPVLITANDYNLGLMNGDIGITFSLPWGAVEGGAQPQSVLRVAFPSADGSDGIRWMSPSRLPHLETVFAMTVHKSQGSEFNHACLVLPDRLNPVVTRELLYTGITRAKNWFSLITGDPHVLRACVRQQVVRASALAERVSGSS